MIKLIVIDGGMQKSSVISLDATLYRVYVAAYCGQCGVFFFTIEEKNYFPSVLFHK